MKEAMELLSKSFDTLNNVGFGLGGGQDQRRQGADSKGL